MSDSTKKFSPQHSEKEPGLVIASEKNNPLFWALSILALPIEKRNPEKPHWRMPHQTESLSDNPEEVVRQKIERVREGLSLEGITQQAPILASDILCYINGELVHQAVRSPEDEDRYFREERWKLKQIKLDLVEKYSKPFEVEWDVTFGMQDKDGAIRFFRFKIRSQSDGLNPKEIYQSFEPRANTGVKLVELLIQSGATFEVIHEGEIYPAGKKYTEITGVEAQQAIVDKFPREKVFWHLYRGDPLDD